MPAFRFLPLVLLLTPAPLLAQAYGQPVGLSDADALAEQVRRLGTNPLDLEALLTAGELSIRLEDYSAAGAFFARAEKIDPRNGRIKAGEGAILVHSERPAEALRFFQQAEQFGLPPARFAAERGLAYDLLGDSGRAQRDYKLALAYRDDPETRRRSALSLGIAGRQAQALDQLAPLIRQNDRAAWRTRAFVLAMGGNAAEALRIAETMMPPGAAASLQQFFTELPRLPAIDRAFAVHFGEVRPTPQRLADARLAPRDPPLPLDPPLTQIASVTPTTSATDGRRNKRDKRDRSRPGREPMVAVAYTPLPQPTPQPPAYQAPAYVAPAATTPVRADRPLSAGEQASLAAAGNRASSRRGRSGQATAAPALARTLSPAEQASLAAASGGSVAGTRVASITPPPARPVPAYAPSPTYAPAAARPLTPPPSTSAAAAGAMTPPPASSVPIRQAAATVAAPIAAAPLVTAAPAPPVTVAAAPPSPGFATGLPAPAGGSMASAVATSPAATPLAQTGETAAVRPASDPVAAPAALAAQPVPASIAATTPGTLSGQGTAAAPPPAASPPAPRLAGVTPVPLAPTVTRSAVTPTPSRPAPGRRAQTDTVLARIVAGLGVPASELEVTRPLRATPGQATPSAAERRAADRRAAAERQAAADRKAAAEAKAEADREAAEQRRAERAEPARIWVQVAGGANEAGLALAWRTMLNRAPDVLTGRQAWTTPLRATNRVLTGPFKTEAEARTVVNQLSKAGVNAFTFTSEAGQKVTRLATR